MKKKVFFKNSTQYSKKLYDTFTRFHRQKFSLSYNIFTIFISILLIYCLIMTIKNKMFLLAIVFAITSIAFVMYRLFSPMFFYKKEITKKSIANEKTYKFYFYDKYFKIRDNLNYDIVPYFRLYKVFETKNFFYLYYNKKYSFILDKNSFTFGSSEEFSKFIKDKMWLKYSLCNKSKNSA